MQSHNKFCDIFSNRIYYTQNLNMGAQIRHTTIWILTNTKCLL